MLLIVEFFVDLGGSFSGGPLVYVGPDAGPSSILAHAGIALGLRLLAAFLFDLVPGLVFLYKGTDWADRLLAPADEPSSHIEFTALLSIGLMLLGCYFIISGLAGLVAGIVSVVLADELVRGFAWRQAASSITTLLCGAVIAIAGHRAGSHPKGTRTSVLQ